MNISESKIKWIAGLSNGETLREGVGITSYIPGQKSPWWKLQDYLKDNSLTINSFYLSYKTRHYHLPSIEPKFGGKKPNSYNCFRKVRTDSLTGSSDNDELYICAEAIYDDYRLQLWIDEKNVNKVWVEVQYE